MTDLRMYTQEEVAEMLHTHIGTITTLREIVNLNYVKEIKNQQVILKNGTVLMASVRKWLLLRERFCNYRSKVIY